MAEWTPHAGGPCPVDPEKPVAIRYRNGQVQALFKARQRRWENWPPPLHSSDWDIVAWSPLPG
jgi:hypothetical protein